MRSAAELSRLSALLDQALDLEDAAREAWLASLGGEDAALSTQLRALLARHATHETADLLDSGPAFTLPAQPEGGAATEFQVGDRVGPFRLLAPLGRGGMGEVWRAEREDGQLRRTVALKLPVLAARRSVLAQRFARERDIVGALAHPHIARLYDAGIAEDGQPWLALEVVDGQPIDEWSNGRQLDARARIGLMQQVLQAVQHAHANLVIHRDLKPGNVLVTPEGQAMLLDFGIAKLLAEDEAEGEETELTRVGGRAMSLQHAAPEQISGAPVSIATDVWALGVLLYELLSGRLPFVQGTRSVLEQQILHDDPPTPSVHGGVLRALGRSRAGELDTIVLKALKKLPAERYATVNALADDLQRWLDHEPVLAQPDSRWYRASRFVARHKAAVATAAAVTVVVIGASAISIRQAQLAREQTRIAQTEARTAQAVQEFLEGIFKANSGDQADPIKARQRTAKELLDEGAARIEKALDDAPEAKLRVLRTLSDMYEDLADFEAGITLRRQRVELAVRRFGKDSAQAGQAWALLGELQAKAEHLDLARTSLDEASRALAHHPDADAVRALDKALVSLHLRLDTRKAVAPAERFMASLQAEADSPLKLEAYMLLGTSLTYAGHRERARAVLDEGIAKARGLGGNGRTQLRDMLLTRGQLAHIEGDFELAITHLREMRAIAQRDGETPGMAVLLAMAQESQVWADMGRLDEAASVAGAALEALLSWPDAEMTAAQLPAFAAAAALALAERGLPEQALAKAALVLGADRNVTDMNQQYLAALRAARADSWMQTGQIALAGRELDLGEQALAAHGGETGSRIGTLVRARWLVAAGRGGEAWPLWQRRRRARGLPELAAPTDLRGLATQAEFRLAGGDREAALADADGALALCAASPRRAHLLRSEFDARRVQASALQALGRWPEAAQAWHEALPLAERLFDNDHAITLAEVRLQASRAFSEVGDRPAALQALKLAQAVLARYRNVSVAAAHALGQAQAALARPHRSDVTKHLETDKSRQR